jgi:Alpha-L-rhamnosidase N-terminal domain./Bacterial alpha-L-rhamnosidase.
MRKILLFFSLIFLSVSAFPQLSVKNLLCDNLVNPIGIDNKQPRFSWQLQSANRNVMQTAYELVITTSDKKTVYSSGKVNSGQSVHIPYAGKALEPAKRYLWRVRVWDNTGKRSNWSETAFWETGLLEPANWQARWIEPGYTEDSIMRTSPLLRTGFTAAKTVRSARLYITAHGIYEAFINGKRVGEACLTPGWTSYNKRLQYQAYDVTSLLQKGSNALGVQLGNGWYRGYLAWRNTHNVYGNTLGVLAQLQITYTDGTTQTVISNEHWKSSTGAIQYSEIYHGEINDARKDKTGWTQPGYNDSDWSGVRLADHPKNHIIATVNEPIKRHETFKPIKIFTTPRGELVADFGQNLTGYVELRVQGKSGDSVKIYHAEVLDAAGNFYTENLRVARQENI